MEGVLSEHEFSPLQFDRRELRRVASLYHVYEQPGKYTEVEANSAHEALTRSQITKPFKISRYALRNLNVLPCGTLASEEEAEATPPAESEAIAAAEE